PRGNHCGAVELLLRFAEPTLDEEALTDHSRYQLQERGREQLTIVLERSQECDRLGQGSTRFAQVRGFDECRRRAVVSDRAPGRVDIVRLAIEKRRHDVGMA